VLISIYLRPGRIAQKTTNAAPAINQLRVVSQKKQSGSTAIGSGANWSGNIVCKFASDGVRAYVHHRRGWIKHRWHLTDLHNYFLNPRMTKTPSKTAMPIPTALMANDSPGEKRVG